MQTLIIKVDTASHATQVANFLKTVPYIKSVVTEKSTVKLTDEDWIKPGRPATDEELEQLLVQIDNDGPGEDSEIVFNRIKKGLKKRL